MEYEFDCVDCGLHVVSPFDTGHALGRRCVGCRFLAGITDKAARDEVYEDLLAKGVIEKHGTSECPRALD